MEQEWEQWIIYCPKGSETSGRLWQLVGGWKMDDLANLVADDGSVADVAPCEGPQCKRG